MDWGHLTKRTTYNTRKHLLGGRMLTHHILTRNQTPLGGTKKKKKRPSVGCILPSAKDRGWGGGTGSGKGKLRENKTDRVRGGELGKAIGLSCLRPQKKSRGGKAEKPMQRLGPSNSHIQKWKHILEPRHSKKRRKMGGRLSKEKWGGVGS